MAFAFYSDLEIPFIEANLLLQFNGGTSFQNTDYSPGCGGLSRGCGMQGQYQELRLINQ